MVIIGVDPGAGGAICEWNRGFSSVSKCPNNASDMSSIVLHIKNNSWVDGDGNCVAYLEKVWSFPTDGKVGLFSFGENYGRWQGVLESHKIPINYILPIDIFISRQNAGIQLVLVYDLYFWKQFILSNLSL